MDDLVSTAVQEAAPVTDNRTPRQKYIDSLRDFCSWLEYHPELAVPSTQTVYVWPTTAQMEMYAREMGKCRKHADEDYFDLTKDFLPALMYEATWHRNEVCERVVVGQEEVVEDVVEVVGKRTVTRDIVEWKCPKVLQPKLAEGAIE